MENLTLEENILTDILEQLPKSYKHHSPLLSNYQLFSSILSRTVESLFKEGDAMFHFGPIGKIVFPYFSFGNINTKHLFGIDEMVIFSFYYLNKSKYKTVIDLGANIGLHSLFMSRCFEKVYSYEPDDVHFKMLCNVLEKNQCNNVSANQEAVASFEGVVEFTRVKGNTTGSHISGSKENVYGEIEKFDVPCVSLEKIIKSYAPDFIKMDVEGQEKNILLNTSIELIARVDIMLEVGCSENAAAIYERFIGSDVYMYSQKNNWNPVTELGDMPETYKDGSLFISTKGMQWE